MISTPTHPVTAGRSSAADPVCEGRPASAPNARESGKPFERIYIVGYTHCGVNREREVLGYNEADAGIKVLTDPCYYIRPQLRYVKLSEIYSEVLV